MQILKAYKHSNTILAFTCTISNLLHLPVLHFKLKCPYLPEVASPFSSYITVQVTGATGTSTYVYTIVTKYKVADKLYAKKI